MEPSERVTWEDCPNCGHAAAVGWLAGRPVEFDCPRGCRLTVDPGRLFAPQIVTPGSVPGRR